MTQQEQDQIIITLGIVARLQSTINAIDELSNCSNFMRELKQKSNNYNTFLENNLHQFYKLSGVKESEKMLIKVAEIDEVCKKIEIE